MLHQFTSPYLNGLRRSLPRILDLNIEVGQLSVASGLATGTFGRPNWVQGFIKWSNWVGVGYLRGGGFDLNPKSRSDNNFRKYWEAFTWLHLFIPLGPGALDSPSGLRPGRRLRSISTLDSTVSSNPRPSSGPGPEAQARGTSMERKRNRK